MEELLIIDDPAKIESFSPADINHTYTEFVAALNAKMSRDLGRRIAIHAVTGEDETILFGEPRHCKIECEISYGKTNVFTLRSPARDLQDTRKV